MTEHHTSTHQPRRPAPYPRTWSNWAGTAVCTPASRPTPTTIGEVQEIVRTTAREGRTLRVAGAGHSFTPLVTTDDTLLSIDALSGIVSITPTETGADVTVLAGTPLHALSPALWEHGLAVPNLGDIDRQSIAGAISTGTHGTGGSFGSLATFVRALDIVLASGECVHCSETEHPELFAAARLSLGSLGVLVRVTLTCIPAFVLHREERLADVDDVIDTLLEQRDRHDHFEFFWFPHTSKCQVKTLKRLPATVELTPPGRLSSAVNSFLSNKVYGALSSAATSWTPLTKPLNEVAVRLMGGTPATDRSYAIFASPRDVRFREMEYAVPAEHGAAVLREIQAWFASTSMRTTFPVEVRFAAADDIPLSTASGRDVCYIAVHHQYRHPDTTYFPAVERIARRYGGRPHWGKMHSLTQSDVRELYPRSGEFLAVRDEVDPTRVFTNAHVREILGA